jgi:hypothetical protein
MRSQGLVEFSTISNGSTGILVRKLLKRGSFTSVEDLQARVFAFIDYYNQTMAKPFKWTYQSKALTV